MRPQRAIALVGTSLIAGILILSGCGTSSSPDSSMQYAVDAPVAEMATSDMAGGGTQINQQVIRSGSVNLISNDAAQMVADITVIVGSYGGSVTSQDLRTTDDQQYANLTVSVPDADLEEFIREIQTLGETSGVSISAVDVTLTVTDLDARIASLTATIDKLNELRDQAATVSDLVAVESELATRTAERDSLVAQRDLIRNQVAESTVYIAISPDPRTSTNSPDFIEGIKNGWFALINLLAGAVTFVGFLIPFALLLIFVIGVIVLARKAAKIRRTRQQD